MLRRQGSSNFHFMMKTMLTLDEKYRAIMKPVFLHNAYFTNPENLLLSMIVDSHLSVRETAFRLIIRSRTGSQERNFSLPKALHFEANDYVDIIDWDKENKSPTFTQKSVKQPIGVDKTSAFIHCSLPLPLTKCRKSSKLSDTSF